MCQNEATYQDVLDVIAPKKSVIGKAAKPHCFRNHSLKLTYYNQKKAWSDTPTFKKWWSDFLAHVRRRTNDRVLLILDNCGPHCGKAAEFMTDLQVEVVMLPPNCTSMYQPMDCGVIAMVKKNYRSLLLSKYIEMFEIREQLRKDAVELGMARGTKGLAQGFTPHLRDVIDLLYEVQEKVVAESLFNCWRKSTLLDRPTTSNNAAAAMAPTTITMAAVHPPETAPVDVTTAASSSTDTSVDAHPTTTATDNNTTTSSTATSSSTVAIAAAWNDIDKKLTGNTPQQESTNVEEFHQKVYELAELLSKSKLGDDRSNHESDENEVEVILDEFAVTLQEHVDLDNVDDVTQMLDGWVGLEDTEFVQHEIRQEVEEMLESALVNDDEIVKEDGERDSEEDINDVDIEDTSLKTVTPEAINELCSQLAEIAAGLKRLKCDNNEFGEVASKVADASSSLRLAHGRFERNRVTKKQLKAPRQARLTPFLKR